MSPGPETEEPADPAQVLRDYLAANDLDYTEADGAFSFGEARRLTRKQLTDLS